MTGRWPANVILSPDMGKALDQQSGATRSQQSLRRKAGAYVGNGQTMNDTFVMHDENYGGYDDEGGASRFFLTAGYEPWEYDWIIANGLTPCGQ